MNPFSGDKLLRFPEKIAEFQRYGKTSGPISLELNITNHCPHNCPACPGEWRSDPDAEMSYEKAIDLLVQFRELGTLSASFCGGGEPMAHPRAVDIFESAKRMGYSVGVITNGAIMTDALAERMGCCCDWVRISLDAATPETFSRVHGVPPEHFGRVKDNIKRLVSFKKSCVVGVAFLTNEASVKEIVPAAELVSKLRADYIQYRPFNFDTYNPTDEILETKKLYETDVFKVLATWPKYELMAEGYEKPYKLCHIPYFASVVNPKCDIQVCCDLKTTPLVIANIDKRKVKEVWDSGDIESAISRIDLAKCPPTCRSNAHNILLERILCKITHEEFL